MAISIHPTTVPFGVEHDESNMLIQSYSRKYNSAKKEVMDYNGDYVAVVHYNLKAEISFEGITTGTPAFTVGTSPTIANTKDGYGITTNFAVLTQAEIQQANEDLHKFSAQATAWSS